MTKRKTKRVRRTKQRVIKTKQRVRRTKQGVRRTKRKVRRTKRNSQSGGAMPIIKVSPTPGVMGNVLTGMMIATAAVKAWDEWMGDEAKIKKIKTHGEKMRYLIDHLVSNMSSTLQHGIEELSRGDPKYTRFIDI